MEQVCHSASLHIEAIDTQQKNAHRTPPNPRTSAERGQENGQRDYRAPSCTMFYKAAQQNRNEVIASLHPKALFFFSTVHGALLFLRTRRKRRGGCIPNKGLHSKKKQKPPFQTGPPPSAPPRQRRRTPLPGANPHPRAQRAAGSDPPRPIGKFPIISMAKRKNSQCPLYNRTKSAIIKPYF